MKKEGSMDQLKDFLKSLKDVLPKGLYVELLFHLDVDDDGYANTAILMI